MKVCFIHPFFQMVSVPLLISVVGLPEEGIRLLNLI